MPLPGLTLLIGTTKGAFLISGGEDRSGWSVRGPFCDGWPVNHIVGDPETGTLWAGGAASGTGPASGAPKTAARPGRSPV